jgi:Zn-dependent protease with chaperone function
MRFWLLGLGLLMLGAAPPPAGALNQAEEIKLGRQEVEKLRPVGFREEPALNKVGEALQAQATRKDLPWHFWVLNEPKDLNAFALPGGFVFITRPYFEMLDGDELAFVIGHEMTHVERNHFESRMKRAQQAQIYDLLAAIVLQSAKVNSNWGTVAGMGATAYYTSYSRKQEKEADVGGYRLAKAAGFDARSAASALDKLKDKVKTDPVYKNVYATHPVIGNREDRLEELAKNDPPTPSRYPNLKTPNPKWAESLPTKEQLAARPGVALRIVGEDGTRWDRKWRKDLDRLLGEQIEAAGKFAVRGDDRADDWGNPKPAELHKKDKVDWLLVLTVKQLSADETTPRTDAGAEVTAAVRLAVKKINTQTGAEIALGNIETTAKGRDFLLISGDRIYDDMTLAQAIRKAGVILAGRLANNGPT